MKLVIRSMLVAKVMSPTRVRYSVYGLASKLLPKEQCKNTGDRNCLRIREMALISSGIGCSWGQGRLLFGDLYLLHTEIFRDNPSFLI